VIVVDNGSSDGSALLVKNEFPSVLLIESRERLGYSAGNNLARGKAEGQYVLFLNSDTKVFPNTLETMVKFMEGDQTFGVSTCLTILPDGRLYYACHRGFPTLWNSFCYFTGLSKLFPKSKFFSGYTLGYLPSDSIHEIDACSGTFLLIRSDLLDQIGWFDQDYYAYGEDIEMCYRVKELGYKVMFNPTVKILHYWGATSGLKSTSKEVSKATRRTQEKWNAARYEAMKIFFNKHYRDRYPFLVGLIVLFAIRLINLLRRGSD
jgi:GT2 family glycosyltransferase